MESTLLKAAPLVVGDLDVRRTQEVHPIGDTIHSSRQPVAESAREVDESPTKFPVDILEVHDHGLIATKPVGDGLCVVERLRSNDVRLRVRDRNRANRGAGAGGLGSNSGS